MSRRLLLALVATTSALTSSAGASATHGIRASFTAAPLVGGGVPDIGYLSLCESGVPRFAWDSCAGSNVAASLAPVRRASGRAKLAGRATEPGSGSKVGAFATGGTEAGPLPPATQPKSGAAPADTDPQGDSVQLSEASVGSGSGGTVTCSPPFDVSVSPGSDIGGCVVVNLTDSVTGSFAPANNSLITDWFDSCGNVVHNSSTIGWHTVGFTTLEDGTLLFDAPWIVPTSGFCFGGDWRLQFTFAETFTDGQTLSDTVSHLFPVSAPPPPPPPSSASGVGSGDATVHDPTPCAGDPVNCTSGNFSEIYTDTAVPGRGPSLALTRTYNSLSASTRGIFGYGWTSPYEAHLTTNSDGSVTVTEADGSGVTATAVGSGYSIPAWADSTLTHNGDGTWTFVRQQTTTDTFDSSGRLTSITDRNGYSTTLVYNAAGQLSTVTDPAGRTLTFTFGS